MCPDIDYTMRARRLRHDDNPMLEWCVGNVVGKANSHGNLYPTKQRSDQTWVRGHWAYLAVRDHPKPLI
jgi:phage terminase large subunit-like protein